MLEMIMMDSKNKITKLLYIDKDGQKLKYHGVSLYSNMVSDIGEDILKEIYQLISVKPHHQYIGDFKEYQVYHDKENDIKHYLKNGIEDFLMFYIHNGEIADLFKQDNKNSRFEKIKNTFKKFHIGDITLIFKISAPFIAAIVSFGLMKGPYTITPEIEYQVSVMTDSVESITSDEIVNFIYNSNDLTKLQKVVLANEDFISDVTPCFKNNGMSYIMRKRLNGLNIKYTQLKDTRGEYRLTNELFMAESFQDEEEIQLEKRSVLAHEFIHMFQSLNCPLYLIEGGAELISSEYFQVDVDVYLESVYNLKLLVETVGPKVMWNYIFSGDDTEFNSYLEKYLDETDRNTLKQQLMISPNDDKVDHDSITNIISKMYKNMYGIDIKDDHTIFDYDGQLIEHKRYFNTRMQKKDGVHNYSEQDLALWYSEKDAIKYNLVTKSKLYRFYKKLSYSEFTRYVKNNNEINKQVKVKYNYDRARIVEYKGKKVIFDDADAILLGNHVYAKDAITLDSYVMTYQEAEQIGLIDNIEYQYIVDVEDRNAAEVKDMEYSGLRIDGLKSIMEGIKYDRLTEVIKNNSNLKPFYRNTPSVPSHFKNQLLWSVREEQKTIK